MNALSTQPQRPPGPGPYCSFCGKGRHEVHGMIAGPDIRICDECIELSRRLLSEERSVPSAMRLLLRQLLGRVARLLRYVEWSLNPAVRVAAVLLTVVLLLQAATLVAVLIK